MRYIIILLLFVIQANAFWWYFFERFGYENNTHLVYGDKKSSTNSSIENYLTIQAKLRYDLLKEIASHSLLYSKNDSLSNFDILTARSIPNLSDLYGVTTSQVGSPLLSTRPRHVLNTMDEIIIYEFTNNIFDTTINYQCAFDIMPTTNRRLKENITLNECFVVDNQTIGFYGVGVNRLIFPPKDLLLVNFDKLQFDEFEVPFGKVQRDVYVENNLILEIPYFTVSQLKNYLDKYTDFNSKTFIPPSNICSAIEKRFTKLLATALTADDRSYIESNVARVTTCKDENSYSFYEGGVYIDDPSGTGDLEDNCAERKANLLSYRNDLLSDLGDVNDEIIIIDAEIIRLVDLIAVTSSNLLLKIYNQQLTDQRTLLNQKIDTREEIQNNFDIVETQLDALGDCS